MFSVRGFCAYCGFVFIPSFQVAAFFAATLCLHGSSDAGSFRGIGILPGHIGSVAYGISGDGTTVVGSSFSAVSNSNAPTQGTSTKWTSKNGLQSLGLAGLATDASNDGTVIIGQTKFSIYDSGSMELFYYKASGSTTTFDATTTNTEVPFYYHPVTRNREFQYVIPDLGPVVSSSSEFIRHSAVTADGSSSTFGGGSIPFGNNEARPVYYGYVTTTSGAPTHVGLGPASGISGDGKVIVGTQTHGDINWTGDGFSPQDMRRLAYRYESGVLEILSEEESHAYGVSADGTVTVGDISNGLRQWEAHKWIGTSPVTLGSPAEFSTSTALAASGDGSTVVGLAASSAGNSLGFQPTYDGQATAVIWDKYSRSSSLQDYLVNQNYLPASDLAGWQLTEARAISDNGLIIAGNGINPSGQREGWVADLRKHVVLHFGDPVPATFSLVPIPGKPGQSRFAASTTATSQHPAASVANPDAVLMEVQAIFKRSGIDNVVVSSEPAPNAVNVFLGQALPGVTDGFGTALTPFKTPNLPNRYAEIHEVSVAAVPTDPNDLAFVSELIAHEVGHALGLFHHNGDGASTTSVMDYDFDMDPTVSPKEFYDAPTDIYNNPKTGVKLGYTHNPRYHLERYVDKTPDSIIRQTMQPGSWDTPGIPLYFPGYGLSNFETPAGEEFMLYNVSLYASGAAEFGEGMALLELVQELTLAELPTLLADISFGQEYLLLASSTPDGVHDIALYTGAAGADGNAGVTLIGQQLVEFRIQQFSSDQVVATLATGQFILIPVPEPSSAVLVLVACTVVLRGRRVFSSHPTLNGSAAT